MRENCTQGSVRGAPGDWRPYRDGTIGKLDDALQVFSDVFEKDKNWLELTKRISTNGILNVDDATFKKILAVKKP